MIFHHTYQNMTIAVLGEDAYKFRENIIENSNEFPSYTNINIKKSRKNEKITIFTALFSILRSFTKLRNDGEMLTTKCLIQKKSIN